MIAAPSFRPTRSSAAPLVWSQFLADRPGARCHLLVSGGVHSHVALLVSDGPPFGHAALGDSHDSFTFEALNPIYLRVFVGAHLVALVKGQSSVSLVRAVRSILTS